MSWPLVVLKEQTGSKKNKSKGTEARKDSVHSRNRKAYMAWVGNMEEKVKDEVLDVGRSQIMKDIKKFRSFQNAMKTDMT